jgi:hypothetical protein
MFLLFNAKEFSLALQPTTNLVDFDIC